MVEKNWYTATAEEIAAETGSRKFIPGDVFEDILNWANIPTADFMRALQLAGFSTSVKKAE